MKQFFAADKILFWRYRHRGRTSRLLMNYQLLSKGFLPVSVAKENRLDYYNALDKYAAQGELSDIVELVAGLEEKQLDKYLAYKFG